jgi:hypothetical protein
MRSVDDIALDDPDQLTAEAAQVGVRALESLEGLWSPLGYHSDNCKLDLTDPSVDEANLNGDAPGGVAASEAASQPSAVLERDAQSAQLPGVVPVASEDEAAAGSEAVGTADELVAGRGGAAAGAAASGEAAPATGDPDSGAAALSSAAPDPESQASDAGPAAAGAERSVADSDPVCVEAQPAAAQTARSAEVAAAETPPPPAALVSAGPEADPRSTRYVEAGAFNLATVVSLEAVLDTLIALPQWFSVPARRQAVTTSTRLLFDQDPEQPDPLHPEDGRHACLRLLRYSLLIAALGKLATWRPVKKDLALETPASPDPAAISSTGDEPTPNELLASAEKLRADAQQKLSEHAGRFLELLTNLESEDAASLHPYVVYRAICAIDAIGVTPSVPAVLAELSGTARATLWRAHLPHLDQLIARHALNRLSAGGSIQLVFGAAIAARMSAHEYVEALLGCVIRDGRVPIVWNQGRILAQDTRDLATLELSFPALEAPRALAEIVLNSLEDKLTTPLIENRGAISSLLLGLLPSTQADYIDDVHDGSSGWAGDSIYGQRVVEAWPTASALGYGVAMAEIVDRVQRSAILAEMQAIEAWGEDWPAWLTWEEYIQNEPEKDPPILQFIDDKVIAPRKDLGTSAKTEAVVVLLFGPPGTTKTTIARSVANGLGWPIVTLSPGNFIEEGLDRLEKQASLVFTRLQKLSRTVVIFDECDELFRKRDPKPADEAVRQVSAFVTASMLPKLQDLHDRSKIVVFICTNFLTSIDSAIKRPGRVDHLIAVAPPDEFQRARVIGQNLDLEPAVRNGMDPAVIEGAVDELAGDTDTLIRGELVSVARALGKALSAAPSQDQKDARNRAKAIGKEAVVKGRTAIDGSDKRYKDFLDDKKVISEPHRNGS